MMQIGNSTPFCKIMLKCRNVIITFNLILSGYKYVAQITHHLAHYHKTILLFAFIIDGQLWIKLGDRQVQFNSDFRFYLTTKQSNPHYTPEISTKTAIVNFAVKEQG